jgi:hypothetical protein
MGFGEGETFAERHFRAREEPGFFRMRDHFLVGSPASAPTQGVEDRLVCSAEQI